MAQPLATRVVRSCARQNDAVGVEFFCCVQIGFEQKRSAAQDKSLQKDGHGEICGLERPPYNRAPKRCRRWPQHARRGLHRRRR